MAYAGDKHLSPASTLLKENSGFRRAQTFINGALNRSNFHRDKNRYHHSSHHVKENAEHSFPVRNSSRNKKSLEILDFHESWREEMELYRHLFSKREQPYARKSINEVNNVTQGEERMKSPQTIASLDNSPTKAVVNRNVSMPKSKKTTNEKQKVRVGATLAGLDASREKLISNQNDLKRRREESPAKVTNRNVSGNVSTKRPNTTLRTLQTPNKKTIQSATPTPLLTPKPATNTNNGIINLNAHHTSGSTTSPNKSNMKIIVNQFHASSILNGHELEEKAKILTQNGLHKTSTTAYEASFYAANYLASGVHHDHMHLRHHNLGDYSNYVGVSLAKYGHDTRNRMADDDPCAAIDDVNTYTDTDSEEEYTGEPFFLEEDTDQQLQSKNIRNQESLKSETECTENTEKTQQSDYYQPSSILSPSLFPNVPPYLNFSSHVAKGPNIPTALHKVLKWKLSPVMPKIVKRVVLNSGFRIIKNTTDWMAIWEKHMKSPGFRTIRSHQKYNHMPGSFRIGRKDTMWRSIYQNMKKFGTKEFGFMQRSYIMPDDLESLRQSWPKNASRLTKWIVKPPASARGTGIRIVNKWSQFPKDRPLVVQKYIERPLLINDNKFDMRIYVVLTSINPIRIYLYKDGLARFASVKYSSELNSLDERCMHLTNYSINKLSQNYAKNEDFNACQGHKWTLQSLWSCLEARGVNTKRLWATLRNLVIKAIISGEGGLNRMYRQNVNFRYNCFEMFGFDVLLDENLIPWLLEINISPSLHSELPLDLHVKGPLIQAVLNTALYQVPPKLTDKQQKEILEELQIKAPLCHDKRIFTTCMTAEEIRKHNQFTNRAIEYREEYLDAILENLLPDDVRCLIVSEDEFARCHPLERIFPTPESHVYLKFIENPRYYNRLLDAWENRYGQCREQGIQLLSKLCEENYHLHVSDAAMENEPDITLTEIDMLHIKKIDDVSGRNADGIHLPQPKSSDTDVPSTNSSVQLAEKQSDGHGQGDHSTNEPKKTSEDALN